MLGGLAVCKAHNGDLALALKTNRYPIRTNECTVNVRWIGYISSDGGGSINNNMFEPN